MVLFIVVDCKITENTCDEMTSNPELIVRRPVYQQEDFDRYYDYTKPTKSCKPKNKSIEYNFILLKISRKFKASVRRFYCSTAKIGAQMQRI